MAVLEDAVAKELVDFIRQQVAAATEPLRDEIKELRAQIAERRFVGGYQRAQAYKCHNICVHDG